MPHAEEVPNLFQILKFGFFHLILWAGVAQAELPTLIIVTSTYILQQK